MSLCAGLVKNLALMAYISVSSPLTVCSVSACRSGEEPGADGLHLGGLPAVPDPGVPGGVEHGEPGGDRSQRHHRVSHAARNCPPALFSAAVYQLSFMSTTARFHAFLLSRVKLDVHELDLVVFIDNIDSPNMARYFP